jgi:NTE family protein
LAPIKKGNGISKSIGLVLSGGGSKGIAHAGAIKF